jgi:effector-binding domain-containing protein
MISDPKTEYRKEQYYVAITSTVRQEEIPNLLPPLIPEIFKWLKMKKFKPAGAPFFKYSEMEGEKMKVEVGIVVDKPVKGNELVHPGVFPSGTYIEVTYKGPYSNLPIVHSELYKWKEKNKIRTTGGVTEFYPTDPASEPNAEKWITIISIRLDENQD